MLDVCTQLYRPTEHLSTISINNDEHRKSLFVVFVVLSSNWCTFPLMWPFLYYVIARETFPLIPYIFICHRDRTHTHAPCPECPLPALPRLAEAHHFQIISHPIVKFKLFSCDPPALGAVEGLSVTNKQHIGRRPSPVVCRLSPLFF